MFFKKFKYRKYFNYDTNITLFFLFINIYYLLIIDLSRYTLRTTLLSTLFLYFLIKLGIVWPNIIFSVILFLGYMINAGFFLIHDAHIDRESILSILNSNLKEGSDWILHNFSPVQWIQLITLAILCVFFCFLLFSCKKKKITYKTIFCIIPIFYLFYKGFVYLQPPSLRIINQYKFYKKMTTTYYESRKEYKHKFTRINPQQSRQIHVVIIGESLSKNRMSLYGYARDTNPLLKKRDDLYVFKNVVAPHTHTFSSLNKVLTFYNSEPNSPHWSKHGSITDIFNQVGFTSFWISNQPITDFLGQRTIIQSFSSTYKAFVTKDLYHILDEKIFPLFEKALDHQAEKKLIIIHLYGNHTPYRNFSPAYHKFINSDSIKDEQWRTQKMIKRMNMYDNTVLYNDFIIDNIIEIVKKKDIYSSIVYFSDHGEEVFDWRPYFGHTESKASKYMLEIPFMVWMSEKFNSSNLEIMDKIQQSVQKSFSTENFIHFYQDFLGVYTSLFDSQNNPLHDHTN